MPEYLISTEKSGVPFGEPRLVEHDDLTVPASVVAGMRVAQVVRYAGSLAAVLVIKRVA